MVFRTGRYWIVFNGDVFNFLQIRAELTHPDLAGEIRHGSDVSRHEEVGPTRCAEIHRNVCFCALGHLRKRSCTWCGTDSALNRCTTAGQMVLLFASEFRPCTRSEFEPVIDRGSLASYLRHNHVPGPRSIYVGVRKLMPVDYHRQFGKSPGFLSRELLVCLLRAKYRSSACRYDGRGDHLAIGRTIAGCGAASHGFRCSDRRLSVGRHRFNHRSGLMQSINHNPVMPLSVSVKGDTTRASMHEVCEVSGTDHVEQHISPSDVSA